MIKGMTLKSESPQLPNWMELSFYIFKDDTHENWDAPLAGEVRDLMGYQKKELNPVLPCITEPPLLPFHLYPPNTPSQITE